MENILCLKYGNFHLVKYGIVGQLLSFFPIWKKNQNYFLLSYENVENGRRKKCHEFKSALHPIMPKLRKCFHPKVSKIVL